MTKAEHWKAMPPTTISFGGVLNHTAYCKAKNLLLCYLYFLFPSLSYGVKQLSEYFVDAKFMLIQNRTVFWL